MKFLMTKIKKLIVDESGDARYMDNFDQVMEDVFGVKNFAHKINDCYDDRDIMSALQLVGLKNLIDICDNPKMYTIFAEMVEMDHRMDVIKKAKKKASKKGKALDKDLVKEMKYLAEVYRDAVKIMRKKFGVKSVKTSYKHRYTGVASLVERKNSFGYDDDEMHALLYDSDDLYDMDDDEDEDDYDSDESGSELDMLMRRRMGTPVKGKKTASFRQSVTESKPQPKPKYRRDFDDDDDDDDDGGDIDLEEKIDALAGIVSNLANVVQMTSNANTSVRYTEPLRQQASIPLKAVVSSADPNITRTINDLTRAVQIMAQKQNEMIDTQQQLFDYIGGEYEDDDVDPSVMPNVPGPGPSALQAQVDKYPDITADFGDEKLVDFTKEDLIDTINNMPLKSTSAVVNN